MEIGQTEMLMRVFLLQSARSPRTQGSRESILNGALNSFSKAHGEPSDPKIVEEVLERLLSEETIIEHNGTFRDNLPAQGWGV